MSNRRLKPIPKNVVEVAQAEITPYLTSGKQPNDSTVFSKNRGNDISVKNNKQKDISIGLEDIDSAILYYFENIIKPTVIQNGQRLAVPVLIGSPERWKSVQSDGFYRDKNGKLMVPLIMFKRNVITKNRNLGNKLDGNKAHLFQVFEERYNPKNAYDKFDILTNRIPSKKIYATVVPDYVTVTYSCILFTDFIEQNNKLIEAIEFASDSYWGDFNRFHFRTQIDSFNTTTILEQGQDRAAKTNFDFTVNGYIIPDSVNKELASIKGFYSKAQVVFDLEVTSTDLNTINSQTVQTSPGMGSTTFTGDGTNVTVNNTYITNINSDDLVYLNVNTSKKAASGDITPTTAIFRGTVRQPGAGSALPPTSVYNFSFFCNGQYIPYNAITSFIPLTTDPILTIDSSVLGYVFETTDEIIAIGKFQ
jgi:hypothetical protein